MHKSNSDKHVTQQNAYQQDEPDIQEAITEAGDATEESTKGSYTPWYLGWVTYPLPFTRNPILLFIWILRNVNALINRIAQATVKYAKKKPAQFVFANVVMGASCFVCGYMGAMMFAGYYAWMSGKGKSNIVSE